MKKKIGDLTLKEIADICKKGCDYCPRKLVAICEETGYSLFLLDNLDQEIEVEENETTKL